MAIDTANKRASSFLDECGILFPPDGTITNLDRGWMVGQYSGIAGGSGGGVSTGTPDLCFGAATRLEVFNSKPRLEVYNVPPRLEVFGKRQS